MYIYKCSVLIQFFTMVRRSARLRNLVNSCDNDHPHQPLWTNQIAAVSSQESSEGEFVEEEKSWPPHRHSRSKVLMRQVTQKLPRPHSHLFRRGPGAGQTRGSGHSRRWENCKPNEQLMRINILIVHFHGFHKTTTHAVLK